MVMEAVNKQSEKRIIYRTQSLLELGVVMAIVAVVNVLSAYYFKRFDLTAEHRYTISETSKNLCGKLKDKLYFRLYMGGEMSADYKRLRNEIRDMVFEFRQASKGKIEIEILDPMKGKESKTTGEILQEFANRGIEPVRDIESEESDETRIRHVVPGADVTYGGKEFTVNFFTYDVAKDLPSNIKGAIEGIEYELANMLRRCIQDKPKKLWMVSGSGEMVDERIASLTNELSKYYSLEELNLNVNNPESGRPFTKQIEAQPDSAEYILLNSLQRRVNLGDALVIVKPLTDYSSAELYFIDQFLVKGGKVMWMLDAVHAEIDSFERRGVMPALDRGLENIQSLLFHYGVGVNSDLLIDRVCNRLPFPVGNRYDLSNFMYFPIFVSDKSSHLISKNVGSVWCQFPGTLTLKQREGIKASPLLVSSQYNKVLKVPTSIDLPTAYTQGRDPKYLATMKAEPKIAALLLEGKFTSAFQYQKKYTRDPFVLSGESKMIVISDGDIGRNYVSSKSGIMPTAYDRFTQVTFSNKKFLLNCFDYLVDDLGLIEIRGKEFTLRLLDQAKVKDERSDWQLLNIGLPLLMVVVLGVGNTMIRRRKYARRAA